LQENGIKIKIVKCEKTLNTRQAMYVQRAIEELSCNRSCSRQI